MQTQLVTMCTELRSMSAAGVWFLCVQRVWYWRWKVEIVGKFESGILFFGLAIYPIGYNTEKQKQKTTTTYIEIVIATSVCFCNTHTHTHTLSHTHSHVHILSLSLSINLSIYLSTYLSTYLSVCLSVCLSIYLSISLISLIYIDYICQITLLIWMSLLIHILVLDRLSGVDLCTRIYTFSKHRGQNGKHKSCSVHIHISVNTGSSVCIVLHYSIGSLSVEATL